MAQYRNINTRSPFYVQLATTEASTNLEIRLWYGDVVTNKPVDATYILDKEQGDGQSTFEIAELIRDYSSQGSDDTSGTVWVETILNDSVAAATSVVYLASEGYSLYNEGVQHNGNSFETDFVALPEETTNSYRQVTFGTAPTWFKVFVQPQNATDWRYRTSTNGVYSSYIAFPIETENDKIFKTVYALPALDFIEFDFNGTVRTVYVDLFECTQYSESQLPSLFDKPITLQYANKFGTRSTMIFTLKHTEDIKVSSDSFQRNTMNVSNLSNNSGLHASRRRITGSKQSFTINTDWISEYYVKQLEELVMSEYVWASIPHLGTINFQPVNLTTQNLSKKNHLNDKLIQYKFKLETASEYINTVR